MSKCIRAIDVNVKQAGKVWPEVTPHGKSTLTGQNEASLWKAQLVEDKVR